MSADDVAPVSILGASVSILAVSLLATSFGSVTTGLGSGLCSWSGSSLGRFSGGGVTYTKVDAMIITTSGSIDIGV